MRDDELLSATCGGGGGSSGLGLVGGRQLGTAISNQLQHRRRGAGESLVTRSDKEEAGDARASPGTIRLGFASLAQGGACFLYKIWDKCI